MFSRLKLSAKVLLVTVGCLIIPIIAVTIIVQISNRSVETLVKTEIKKMADDHLTDVVTGIYYMVDEANRAAVISNCTAVVQNARHRIQSLFE